MKILLFKSKEILHCHLLPRHFDTLTTKEVNEVNVLMSYQKCHKTMSIDTILMKQEECCVIRVQIWVIDLLRNFCDQL